MTDDKKLDLQPFVAQTAIGVGQKVEVFLPRNAAHVKQANLAIACAEFFEERRFASSRLK